MILLNESEMANLKGGELTLMAVMTVLVAAIVAVIIYRLFMSDKGSTSLPGGFNLSWG